MLDWRTFIALPNFTTGPRSDEKRDVEIKSSIEKEKRTAREECWGLKLYGITKFSDRISIQFWWWWPEPIRWIGLPGMIREVPSVTEIDLPVVSMSRSSSYTRIVLFLFFFVVVVVVVFFSFFVFPPQRQGRDSGSYCCCCCCAAGGDGQREGGGGWGGAGTVLQNLN